MRPYFTIVFLLFSLLLGGCGMRGPLTLTPKSASSAPPPAQVSPAAEAPASRELSPKE